MTKLPNTPEELAWEMVRSKHMNRSWLYKRCADAFCKPSDHILSPRVADLRSGDAERLSRVWSCNMKRSSESMPTNLSVMAKWPIWLRPLPCLKADIMNNFFIVPFTMQVRAPALEVESVVEVLSEC